MYFIRCVGQKNSGGLRNFAIFEPITVICTRGGHRICLIWRTSTGKLSMAILKFLVRICYIRVKRTRHMRSTGSVEQPKSYSPAWLNNQLSDFTCTCGCVGVWRCKPDRNQTKVYHSVALHPLSLSTDWRKLIVIFFNLKLDRSRRSETHLRRLQHPILTSFPPIFRSSKSFRKAIQRSSW